jgi:hypothetical protein
MVLLIKKIIDIRNAHSIAYLAQLIRKTHQRESMAKSMRIILKKW